eukprot:COSAG02_NODE_30719_length_546_cov_1.158837_1_plen_50_part_10
MQFRVCRGNVAAAKVACDRMMPFNLRCQDDWSPVDSVSIAQFKSSVPFQL